MKENTKLIAFTLFTSVASLFVYNQCINYFDYLKKKDYFVTLEQDSLYTHQASKLVDYYYRQGQPTRFAVVKDTLTAIDRFLPHYFPDGPFTNKDLIAIAMVESEFGQYLVGTSGEKGIFQIMEESSRGMGVKRNQFDVEVNTELALFVLREKFKKHQDYRKAIIAYNGVVVRNNKWDETYWKKFMKARTSVDIIFRDLK